jgi:pilus assembly protein FimV
MIKFLLTSICALALAGAALGASAAELGEIAPRSYIGQPLAVDIDLTALTPEEVAGLQVRLADQNVYRGANVTMNPALASVRLQVERRGAKSVLHVTTTRAVDADYVHLYVELGVPGKQDVRLATVWLQKDPNPPPVVVAAPPVPPASVMTPAQAEQIVAQAKGARAATVAPAARAVVSAAAKPVVAEAPVASASGAEGAPAGAPARDRSKPAPLPSVHEAEAGAPGEVKAAGQAQRIAGVWVGADGKVLKTAPREEPAEVPMRVAQALLPLAPLPLPKGVKRPQASCAPTGMSAKECVALDNHNAELSSKLLELEGKMKVLQGALGATSSAAAISMTPPPVKAAGHGGAQAASVSAATAASAPAANAATTATASAAHTASAAASATAAHGGEGKGAASAPAEAEHGASTPANAAAAAASAQASTSAGASDGASASAAASASVPPAGPVKQIRVLPKLKYKKEKPPEPQTDYTLPLAAGGIGLLALLGAGYFWWRKKKSGRGPLQIWQGFRKKKPAEPAVDAPTPAPAAEAAPESVAS